MEAYRDQYATLFNNGRNVVVIGISVDPDTTLASWARESDFPMVFASDQGSKAGALYDAFDPKRNQDTRALYVIDKDGRVAYITKPFRPLVAAAYTELAAIVDNLSPAPTDSL
ncbi:MAG TPA: redoxin domain-containing protein [Gemmatimonadaceae bacterium]|nr:redoxin domain-containing protein [Gemmatimonadaceae bacterium]